ncbi:MAG: beta-glucuronidase [Akkermansiaceae bacterium]|nr:beta-glucuronidase [Akkermansiaceae bacterium]
MLYPQESESREIKDLSGIWRFRADRNECGRRESWFAGPLTETIPMPVPCSYNDVTQDRSLRDHIGEVWYETTFFVPTSWAGKRVWLRFASADHAATAWVNGHEAVSHKGGFLPFAADVSELVEYGAENRLSVAVDNILTWETLPPGVVKSFDDMNHPAGYRVQDIHFDFFHYAGLNRPVLLVATPRTLINDITVRNEVNGGDARMSYDLSVLGECDGASVVLHDGDGNEVARADGLSGEFHIPGVRLWKPGAPQLYQLECRVRGSDGADDVYRLETGVRTVRVTDSGFFINDEPFYFQGCCKHEDMDVKGRAEDHAMMVKDFNLMDWLGANSTRTSHYPYSEEFMRLADRQGLVIIDEAPAVGMRSDVADEPTYSDGRISARTLAHHMEVMRELIARDKNHPCVVMWSVANEPIVNEPAAGEYFKRVIAETRRLDPTRPVTLVTGDVNPPEKCYPFAYVDVMCINRYHSWYSDPGHTELIELQTIAELSPWHEYYKKPLIISEYGADTIPGLHSEPPVMFSEEYQVAVLEEFHKGFDKLPFVIGEHVWNFADFATKQGITRVGGNKKGVFTRQRQPKAAAHALRARWHQPRRKTV